MPFPDDEVEDGTGKSTATVYEQNAVTAAWLTARGLTVFAGKTDTEQQQTMRYVTAVAEDQARKYFRGGTVSDDQALLWPAIAAYGQRGGLYDADTVPETWKAGLRLLYEEHADGTFLASASAAGIKREWDEGGGREFRDGFSSAVIATAHPAAWSRLRAALPPPL